MTDSAKRSELIAQIAALRQEQTNLIEHVTYIGWSPEARANHLRRADRVAALLAQLGSGE